MEKQALQIVLVKEYSESIRESLSNLLPQLREAKKLENKPLTEEYLREVIASDSVRLFVAKLNGKIVGSLSLVYNYIPSGKKVWIEDLVIDEEFRRKGIAEELIHTATKNCKDNNIAEINLTSNPVRIAANKLYPKLGFFQRLTNVYRKTLK